MEPSSSGGPAPFLQKTYDMVDDSSTNAIVSWDSTPNTFVVWDPLEFARSLLPTYFKHNNFSSFIRQLNTYGFRKIDPEKWAFCNEDFVRGERHRLKSIHRKKPVHSHSQPVADSERATLEEEIERLMRENQRLREEMSGFGKVEVWGEDRLEEIERKLSYMEQKQDRLIGFLSKATKDQAFVEQMGSLIKMESVDFSSFSKRRRSIPGGAADVNSELLDNVSNDGYSSTSRTVEFGLLFPHDFRSKLKLQLSPSISVRDLVLDEPAHGASSRPVEVEDDSDVLECRPLLPDEVEVLDTGVSLCQRRSSSLPWLPYNDDEDEHDIPCQLKLTLASSPLHFEESQFPDRVSKSPNNVGGDDYSERLLKERDIHGSGAVSSTSSIPLASAANNQGNAPTTGRVNDVFWEQFLTERPGTSETEEASSFLRSGTHVERMVGSATWMNRQDMGAMKL